MGGAAASEMPLYEYIANLAGKPTDKFVMPVPSFNVINGGSHAGNRLACQEFMILPTGASSFIEAMCVGAEVYHALKGCIKKKYGQDACNVGDEGGFAPSVQANEDDLDFKNNDSPPEMKKTADQMIEVYQGWISKYPFVSIEDPFDQDDWDAYKACMAKIGKDQQIVGDDLLVTNPKR